MINKFSIGGKFLNLAVFATLLASQAFAGFGGLSSYAGSYTRTINPASAVDYTKGPRIFTEKTSYVASESVRINGEGYEGYERVRFAVGSESKTGTSGLVIAQWDVYADGKGRLSTTWDIPGDGGSFVVTATGDVSGMTAKTTIVTDNLAPAAIALEQCQNGTAPANNGLDCVGNSSNGGWVTGNVNSSKAQFAENQFIPYRMVFTNLVPNQLYSFVLGYDVTKAGNNAVDYLGTYNQTVSNANPCLNGTTVNGFCNAGGVPTTEPIPYDNATLGAAGPGGSGPGGVVVDTRPSNTAYPKAQISGNATIWGGDFVDPVGPDVPVSYGTITCASGGTFPTGTCSQYVKFFFRANDASPTSTTSGTVVIAVGAHIGARTTWGTLNGAVGISGSPYHGFKQAFRNESFDTDLNVGAGDIQLAVDAVTLEGTIVIYKHAAPVSSYGFGFSADFNALGYTAGTPITGIADTVEDLGHVGAVPSNSGDDPGFIFQGMTEYGIARTVTETDAGPYSLTGAVCATTVSAGLGTSTGTFNGTTGVNINLSEGDTVTCTFFNSFLTAAEAIVQGRVFDPNGFPVKDAWVSGTDGNGNTSYARTNQFGYYKINGLEAGTALFLDVVHKRFDFPARFVTLDDEVTTVNFNGSNR